MINKIYCSQPEHSMYPMVLERVRHGDYIMTCPHCAKELDYYKERISELKEEVSELQYDVEEPNNMEDFIWDLEQILKAEYNDLEELEEAIQETIKYYK